MKTFALLCLIPLQLFSCQDHEEKIKATIYWVNDVLYIEANGHLYYSLTVKHSINYNCEKL